MTSRNASSSFIFGLILLAVGAVLKWAVSLSVSGLDLAVIGVIMMVVGGVAVLVGVAQMLAGDRSRIETVHEPDRTVVEQRRS